MDKLNEINNVIDNENIKLLEIELDKIRESIINIRAIRKYTRPELYSIRLIIERYLFRKFQI